MLSRRSAVPGYPPDQRSAAVNRLLVRAGIDARLIRERTAEAALCSAGQVHDARGILRLAELAIALGAVP